MKIPMIGKIPKKMETLLGPEGSDQFRDFMNYTWETGAKVLLDESNRRFEKSLSSEIGKLREEIGDFKNKTEQGFAETKIEFANVRAEMKEEFANVRAEMREGFAKIRVEAKSEFLLVYKEFARLHETISNQTKWMVGLAVTITVFLPIITRLVEKYL